MKLVLLSFLALCAAAVASAEPLRLHAKNPHYFEFQGRPTVLITSTEHYGAVLNPDFDFITYLDTLKAAGLNLTRTEFSEDIALRLKVVDQQERIP